MYKSIYFKLRELLPTELGEVLTSIGWALFDDRILKSADFIREKYGLCFVNKDNLTQCGFRLTPVKARFSQHLYGRALDLHISVIERLNLTKEDKIKAYDKVRDELFNLPEFKGIRFEYGISWLHIDCANSDIKKFYAE
jgi:hypothetical protein